MIHTRKLEPLRGPCIIDAKERWHLVNARG